MSLFDELMQMGVLPEYGARAEFGSPLSPSQAGREMDELTLLIRAMQQEAEPAPVDSGLSGLEEIMLRLDDIEDQYLSGAPATEYLMWPDFNEPEPYVSNAIPVGSSYAGIGPPRRGRAGVGRVAPLHRRPIQRAPGDTPRQLAPAFREGFGTEEMQQMWRPRRTKSHSVSGAERRRRISKLRRNA